MQYINNILWIFTIVVIVISGLYFSIKIKFNQFNFWKTFKALKSDSTCDAISPVETLMITLAARIGVGTISGVALAIYIGGVGSIFWMWIAAIFASSATFLESVLGSYFHEKDSGKIYKGGPSYYIEKGIKKTTTAKIYAVLIILAYIIGFLTIQSNTIAIGISSKLQIHPLIIGIIIAIFASLIILKGIKGIAKATNFLVPFMGMLYTVLTLIIIVANIEIIPEIFVSIFENAFKADAVTGGILSVIIIGIQRSIFSNEAGVGTGAIASAVSDDNNHLNGGYIQSFGVFVDTLIFGTLTALVIICSNYSSLNIIDPNGIEIAEYAFNSFLGEFGSAMLLIIIILFAFSSIITGYYYGESSLKFIKKNANKKDILILKIITIILLVLGSVLSSTFLWIIVDIFVALLAIINIWALWKLKDIVFDLLKNKNK